MNVGNINQSIYNNFSRNNNQKKAENNISFEIENSQMRHTSSTKDDLVSKFWNLTDSMPRENQVSFAANIVASRIMQQGITDENKTFIQNISNRFSAEEIGSIKQQVMNNPAVKSQNSSDVQKFLQEFDQFISNQKTEELDSLKKQQASPRLMSPEQIFFQTTLNANSTAQLPIA